MSLHKNTLLITGLTLAGLIIILYPTSRVILQGNLEIVSNTQQGTTVIASVPLQ